MSVFGKVLVPVQTGECEYQIVCIVAELLSYPLILGWDGFLLKYEAIIDSITRRIRLLISDTSKNYFLYLADSITVHPLTEFIASVEFCRKTQDSHKDIFIGLYEPLFRRTGLTVLPGIHHETTNNNELNIVLTNLSTQTVLLEKYSIVALIEPFELQKLDHLNTIVNNNLPFKVETHTPMDELNNEEQNKVGELLNKYGDL